VRIRRAALVLTGLLVLILSGTAAAKVPPGFFGVVPQQPLAAVDYQRLRGLAVTVRVAFDWREIEPEPGRYDFSRPDAAVATASAQGQRVLPVVLGTPGWAGVDPLPATLGSAEQRRAWPRLLEALVRRYGPGGDFWDGTTRARPLRRWQIWNEPNFKLFWGPHPTARAYADLLRLSAPPIRRLDPGAQIVAAGLAPIEGTYWPWEYLRRLYRVPGASRDFDVVALHPYAGTVVGVETEVRRTRRAMALAGDGRTPLLLTELGVASDGRRPSAFDRGPRGQAEYLRRLFGRLAEERRRWRIAGAYWFTWRDGTLDDPSCVFCEFAGLFDRNGVAKPAWHAFRRSVSRG
jgi:polysaccharide biosynthesis protein PslG